MKVILNRITIVNDRVESQIDFDDSEVVIKTDGGESAYFQFNDISFLSAVIEKTQAYINGGNEIIESASSE